MAWSVTLLAFGLSSFRSTTASQPLHVASPEGKTNLICHTSNPAECYPAIFSPTKNFQRIHDDQSIPPGLHVRLNLETGLKEARLNLPEEDETDRSAVVVIDNTHVHNENSHPLAEGVRPGTMDVEEPQIDHLSYEADHPSSNSMLPNPDRETRHTFDALISRLVSYSPPQDTKNLAEDMRELTELAHDAKWGLTIASNTELARHLWRFMRIGAYDIDSDVRSASALLLGTAVQNYFQANSALIGNFELIFGGEVKLGAFIHEQLKAIKTRYESGTLTDGDTIFASRLIFLQAQVSLDYVRLFQFINDKGLDTLSQLFAISVEEISNAAHAKLRAKISNFVIDYSYTLVKQMGNAKAMLSICRKSIEFLNRATKDVPGYASVCEARKVLEDVLGDRCDKVRSDCKSKDINGEL